MSGPATGGLNVLNVLGERWQRLAARERRAVALAVLVLGAYLLWAVALAPALRTLRTAPAQLASLERELQTMQQLAAETEVLRATRPVSAEQSAAALQAATERLGDRARLVLQGDRAVLTVNGAAAQSLREWLAEARAGARVRPVEVRLTRTPQGFSGNVVVAIGGGG